MRKKKDTLNPGVPPLSRLATATTIIAIVDGRVELLKDRDLAAGTIPVEGAVLRLLQEVADPRVSATVVTHVINWLQSRFNNPSTMSHHELTLRSVADRGDINIFESSSGLVVRDVR